MLIFFANGNRSGQDGKFSIIGNGEDNAYPDPSPHKASNPIHTKWQQQQCQPWGRIT
jgi:hypothetical protein